MLATISPQEVNVIPARPQQRPTTAARRVLVVDDNPSVRSAVSRFLRMHQIGVDEARDGKSALEHLASGPVDFVLLDVDMPGMNGFEVCKRIKSDPKRALTPVILLTALDTTDDRIRGAEAGCDGYLAKPVPPPELLARVKAAFRQSDEVKKAIRAAVVAAVEAATQPR